MAASFRSYGIFIACFQVMNKLGRVISDVSDNAAVRSVVSSCV